MCGIIGMIGKQSVASPLLDSLRRLEYRGYDSAGIATLEKGRLSRRRARGKLCNLEAALVKKPLHGRIGIGHTRWATHGRPNELNAHPHAGKHTALVHNGIIENYRQLREELTADGYVFASETDSEVVVHLVDREINQGHGALKAVQNAVARLSGAFALAFLFAGQDDLLIAARRNSPLAVGYGDGEMFVGSDAIALAPFTEKISYLNDGDIAVIGRDYVNVFNQQGEAVSRPIIQTSASSLLVEKGNHRHFMAKEIDEQPQVVGHTLASYADIAAQTIKPQAWPFDARKLNRVSISGCGTAYYAGMIAKYWIERFARLPVDIELASELRYRESPMRAGDLSIFVSQSGETADTLASLRYAKEQSQHVLSVVNVPTSSIARESDVAMLTHAGPEVGVASTKAFTSQLMTLATLAIRLGEARGHLAKMDVNRLVTGLAAIPGHMSAALELRPKIKRIARELSKSSDVLYLGRGTSYPLALEGALKLKEISYIHAEGYAAGELKHGPIALIDQDVPVVVIAPFDRVFDKTLSNMEEVAARGGKIILLTDSTGAHHAGGKIWKTLVLPDMPASFTSLVYAIPVQLLAYYTALERGTDVDQPRNLAKSVTVE